MTVTTLRNAPGQNIFDCLTKPSPKLCVALGTLIALGGLYLLLSSQSALPWSYDAVPLNAWALPVSCVAVAIGGLAIVYGLWKTCHKPRSQPRIGEPSKWQAQEDQICRSQKSDVLSRITMWKIFYGRGEIEQTFTAFADSPVTQANSGLKLLKIILIDPAVSHEDKMILKVVECYLAALHGVEVTLSEEALLSAVDARRGQYAIEPNLEILSERRLEGEFILGFTGQDLYPSKVKGVRFIFGIGSPEMAVGLFSTCWFKLASQEKFLKRLMKLAAHEFGHMRGIEHCTKYACCMQGGMSVSAIDKTPLTFCAQDMAKICHLNGWSLQQGYQKHLAFFENFKSQFGLDLDFSAEIAFLKKKMIQLESPS